MLSSAKRGKGDQSPIAVATRNPFLFLGVHCRLRVNFTIFETHHICCCPVTDNAATIMG